MFVHVCVCVHVCSFNKPTFVKYTDLPVSRIKVVRTNSLFISTCANQFALDLCLAQ